MTVEDVTIYTTDGEVLMTINEDTEVGEVVHYVRHASGLPEYGTYSLHYRRSDGATERLPMDLKVMDYCRARLTLIYEGEQA